MITIILTSNKCSIFYSQKLCLIYSLKFQYKSLFLSFMSGNMLSCYAFLKKLGLLRLLSNNNEY